jgi:pyruvate dehydrogenase E2 component (dihydrolipoamide acetyltransferase)
MATPVIMPKVEMAQEEATIIEWLRKEGEQVTKGEPLLEVETDKVTMVVESPATGMLEAVRGEPGEQIPVTETIAYILEPGENLPKTAVGERRNELPAKRSSMEVTPVAKRLAAAKGVDLQGIQGTGPQGRITKSDVTAVLTSKAAQAPLADKVRATPAARRIARERGIDLSALSGSGPRGRIQAQDVKAQAQEREKAKETIGAPEIVPLKGMRRTIAKRMTLSYQTAPHITLGIEVDMRAFEETRARLNLKAEENNQSPISVTALLVKITAWALKRHPWLNSTLQGDEIRLLPDINIGVAVALEQGLIVPVVRAVDTKGVSEIAIEIKELIARATENHLRATDLSGGTFTISNLGSFGIEEFTAIINPPEAAILAVGAIRSKFVPDEEGRATTRPMMHLTLSADHRIVDGATGARFLNDLQDGLEDPALLLW